MEKDSGESGSLGVINSETESPPVNGGVGDVAAVVPSPAAQPQLQVMSGSGDLTAKKRRGRPRKYDADGNLRMPYKIARDSPPPGFSISHSSDYSGKRGRGRSAGSGNWQVFASLVKSKSELSGDTAGGDFTPHVINVYTGEDVASKILTLVQKGTRGICVLSANGAVSNVTIRQPGSSGGILTYEGRFEILSLTGSFTISESCGVKSRTGGLSVSLAGPDGRVFGGGISGKLMAASPIQDVAGSFMPCGYKTHKRKQQYEPRVATAVQSPPDVFTAASPISQAAPVISFSQIPTSHLPVQSHVVSDNNITRFNHNYASNETADWNASDLRSDQRPSPDINLSAPDE